MTHEEAIKLKNIFCKYGSVLYSICLKKTTSVNDANMLLEIMFKKLQSEDFINESKNCSCVYLINFLKKTAVEMNFSSELLK